MRPSEEVAFELYKKYGPGSKGAIVGFTFDLGEINDPVYGTAKNLRGEFPFALAPGEFTLPVLHGQPVLIQKYAEELLPHCRDAMPDLLDEEIIAKLKDYAIVCILWPSNDPCLVKGFMLILAFAWVLDDLIDAGGPEDAQTFTYKSLQGFIANACAKAQESSEAIWGTVPSMHFSFEGAKAIANVGLSLIEQGVPKFLKALFSSSSPYKAELQLSFQALYAIKEAANEGKQYSKTTLFELYSSMSGNRMLLEATLILLGLEIPPEIRSDILFKTSLHNFADMMCFYNAILGLPRDVRKKQEDSPIMHLVTVQKKSLQEAFDEIYTATEGAFNDYMISTKKLLEVYEDVPNLKKYVERMSYYMAGTLHGYKCLARYGIQGMMNVNTKEI